ncbi:protein shisa-like-2A isoform X2 [Malaclemys terrapin pileata]|uniref:protein shisa-like-2A isoform X2 n=1 Tax=Malaclemys terrapin pileata TaxID=2991368 RepID=UPI0023A87F71|nr:protein shisa-like-2A isoform X2 [Malaclemys terrapin pileata]
MSSACTSYLSPDGALVSGFSCPRADGEASAVYCCGFQDVKYCCDDPNSFFPYEHGYMWWLSTKPRSKLDTGLSLQTTGRETRGSSL